MSFQFTQPKWAANPIRYADLHLQLVSIHAAQAGCDWACRLWCTRKAGFNSRSPSGLRRRQHLQRHRGDPRFNSRSPSGLRQSVLAHLEALGAFQFTQPKRAATWFYRAFLGFGGVSIHAAQAGCDHHRGELPTHSDRFNSRSPSGLRLCSSMSCNCLLYVSIHAAQASCDFGDV